MLHIYNRLPTRLLTFNIGSRKDLVSSYSSKQQSKNERDDIERELKSSEAGYFALKEYPEFAASVRLTKRVHEFLITVPSLYAGFVDQLERAVVSISCNVVESRARARINGMAQYMIVARASAYETKTLLLVSPVPVPEDITKLSTQVCDYIDRSVKELAQEKLNRLG